MQPSQSPIGSAIRCGYGAFIGIGLFSCVIILLMLTGPFFMLQVYDRVLAGRSVPTLAVFFGLVAALYVFQGARSIWCAAAFCCSMRGASLIFDMVAAQSLTGRREGDGQQPVRDLDQIRQS